MNFDEAFFILEHGSYEGLGKYLESIQVVKEYFKCLADENKELKKLLKNVQTVNHSKWIICSDGYYPYCSECKHEPQGREMTKFCPNCGAKMDGD